MRARFPEPLPEGAREVAALWPHVLLENRRLDLKAVRFPWRRAFEAEPELRLLPLPWGTGLVE